MDIKDVEILGRKVFFIAPDPEAVPESYLERFMSFGYETYIINDDDKACPLKKKVESIISVFPGAMLFFNINAEIEDIEWRSYIRSLLKEHRGFIMIGVLFDKDAVDEKERRKMEEFYQRDVAIQCKCVPLAKNDDGNFTRLRDVLEEKGARGRRKLVRALCDENSVVSFKYNDKKYFAKILDVNMSHFSCDLGLSEADFPMYQKVHEASMNINGMHFYADAALIMRSVRKGVNLCIFMFIRPDGTPELDDELRQNLNRQIYMIVSGSGKKLLADAFAR